MKKAFIAAMTLLLAVPMFAAKLENVPLVDMHCGETMADDKASDNHEKSCLMKCAAKHGYGVLKDGKVWKLDEKGNELATKALKASDKKDHIRVNIEGEVKDDTVVVSSLTLN